jgi:hypothetical protein
MLEIIVTLMLIFFACDWYTHRDDEKNAKRDAEKWHW